MRAVREETMAETGGAPEAGLKTKLAYGLGSVAFGTKDAGFNTFLLIFYNQVMGIPATLVSLAIMVALVSDAIFDPIIGEISDNWRSRLGRRHPFMYASALPIAVLYFLLWNPPLHWSTGALFGYLVVVAVLVRMAIACYEIPSAALVPELSTDYNARTSWMGFRVVFGLLGAGVTIAVAFLFFMVATHSQPMGILNQGGYFKYSIMAALVMFTSILVSAYGTHARIPYLKAVRKERRTSLGHVAREVFESLSNKSFILVTIAALLGGVAGGIVNSLNTYFGTYFWKFTPQQLSVLGLAALIAAVLAMVLAPIFSRRFEKKRAFIVSSLSGLVINNVVMVAKLFHLLPPDGSNALLLIFFLSWTVGLALAIASLIIVLSMITDVVEDSELKTGRRSEGLFSASISFVGKASGGFGVLIAGLLIDFVHFPAHASVVTLDPAIPRNLVLYYMPVQLVLYFAATVVLSFYRIDKTTHESNLAKLKDAAALLDVAEEGGAGEIPAPTRAPVPASPINPNQPLPAPGE
jgi:Na+/melibiose symporter-like transporter